MSDDRITYVADLVYAKIYLLARELAPGPPLLGDWNYYEVVDTADVFNISTIFLVEVHGFVVNTKKTD